jgi:hypothetical protein
MVDTSSAVTMLTSIIVMDHSRTPYEKTVFTAVLMFVAYIFVNGSAIWMSIRHYVDAVFRPKKGSLVFSYFIMVDINSSRMIDDQWNSNDMFAILRDIENSVQARDGDWHLHDLQVVACKSIYQTTTPYIVVPSTKNYIRIKNDHAVYVKISSSDVVCQSGAGGKGDVAVTAHTPPNVKKYTFTFVSTEESYSVKDYVSDCVDALREERFLSLRLPKIFIRDLLVEKGSNGNAVNQAVWRTLDFKSTKSFDSMFFERKTELIQKITNFSRDKSEYERLSMPYTLSFLFHGEPGTGKTSVIKAIANTTGRHLVIIPTKNINTIEDLKDIFYTDRIHCYDVPVDKRLYVFEEIDCGHWRDMVMSRDLKAKIEKERHQEMKETMIQRSGGFVELPRSRDVKSKKGEATTDWKGGKEGEGDGDGGGSECGEGVEEKVALSKNSGKTCKLELGEFLEFMDGIVELSGRMIIFSTNCFDVLDPAIVRPGRVDHVVEFTRMRRVDVRDMYRHWFGKDVPTDVSERMLPDRTFTQADVGNIFLTRDMDYIHARLEGRAPRNSIK